MKFLPTLCSFLFVLLLHVSFYGQTYTFSTYEAEYQSVGVGFPLTEGVWDDPNYVVPIGYGFSFFENTFFNLESLEESTLGGALVGFLKGTTASVLGVHGADLIDRGFHTGNSMSAIFFAHFGTPGQRVFVQEWLNVGFAGGDTVNGIYTDFINFQLQLHEATREIIFHYGPSNITNPLADYDGHSGPPAGLFKAMDVSIPDIPEETILLTGPPSNPTVVTTFEQVYLDGSIPENRVYRFTPQGTAVSAALSDQQESTFFPNPTSGEILVRESNHSSLTFPLLIYSMQGILVKEIADANQLNVYDLPAGIYHIRFHTGENWKTERITVMR